MSKRPRFRIVFVPRRRRLDASLAMRGALESPLAIKLSQVFMTLVALIVTIACSAPAAVWAGEDGSEQRPNVVLILADDMGFGDVQTLNPQSAIPTPHLDQLASDGMTFLDAHSPSAVCTPTRYGLLTGRYCWRTSLKRGVLGGYSDPLIDADRATLGTLLKMQGYRTAAIGKWHLGMKLPYLDQDKRNTSPWEGDPGIDFTGTITDSPIDHGFDDCFNVSASLDMAPYVYIRNRSFTKEPTIQQPAVKFPHFVRQGPRADDFVIDEVLDRLTDEATRFIESAAKEDEPFFLYLPLTGPHKPTQPHERFRGKTGLNEYGDFVAQVDWTVGQVLQAIDDAGERDNTLVIYTSDNGSYMFRYDDESAPDHVSDPSIQGYRADHHRANGPYRGTKADIFEAGHHVPLFVRWPGHVEAGSTCQQTVCHVDWFATLAEITGVELDDSMAEDSCSLLAMMHGDDVERAAPVIHHSVSGMFAIRQGKWKLILGNGSGGRERPAGRPFEKPYQLYDMQSDPEETTNVADQHQELVEQLTAKVDAYRSSGRSRPASDHTGQ